MSGFSSVLQDYPLLSSGLMVLVSIFTGISGFLNLGGKTQQHFNSEALYGDLALKIELEMCKPKKNRMSCSVLNMKYHFYFINGLPCLLYLINLFFNFSRSAL